MPQPYEYMPPSGRFNHIPSWDVELSFGSELIRRRVSAVDKQKALNKVVMELAKTCNIQPSIMFRRVNSGKRSVTQVTAATDFIQRASTLPPIYDESFPPQGKVSHG